MKRANLLVLMMTVIGLAVAVWTFGSAGVGDVAAIGERMGAAGFAIYCLWCCGVFVVLGAAWLAVAPGESALRILRFAWARAVREAVADLLPLSQIGGIVVGARTLMVAGVPAGRTYAALIVDMTTELASQLLFTAFGIVAATQLIGAPPQSVARSVLLGAAAALAILVALVAAGQRLLPGMAESLVGRLIPGSLAALATLREELAGIYLRRRRVLLAFFLNLLAWIASASGAWIMLRLAGIDLPPARILALESLIFTFRSVAFAVPGGLGVQEAGYALIAPALGLPTDAAMALALAKRARDLALGVPTIVLWQLAEGRSLVASKRKQKGACPDDGGDPIGTENAGGRSRS